MSAFADKASKRQSRDKLNLVAAGLCHRHAAASDLLTVSALLFAVGRMGYRFVQSSGTKVPSWFQSWNIVGSGTGDGGGQARSAWAPPSPYLVYL